MPLTPSRTHPTPDHEAGVGTLHAGSRRDRTTALGSAGMLAVGALLMLASSAPAFADADANGHDARSDAAAPHQPHLPVAVNAPGTWSSDEGVRGPVAALGFAERTRTDGVFDDKQSLAMFAVSAVDGSASWVRLPGFSPGQWGFADGFAVSPDGRWIGWVRPEHGPRPREMRVAGWSAMDTTTGRVRRFEDPAFSWVRGTMEDLEFSGDSRYLLTSYETPDHAAVSRSRAHQLVAWDVQDGTATVVEKPGHYWLPNLGSAPTGVVWARRHRVFRVDPRTGGRTSLTLPQDVITASWGPDDASFAYIGRPSIRSRAPWRLYAGRSVEQARGRVVDLPSDVLPGELLGWRDATHVVVGHYRHTVHVVDIVSGEVDEIDMTGDGRQMNAPHLAGALWRRPLGTATEPEGTTDPRRPWRRGGAGALALGMGVLVVRRRRGRLDRRPGPDVSP